MITSPRWDNLLHLEDKDQDNRPSQSRDEQAYIEKQYQNSTRRSQKDYMVSLKTHTSYTNKTLTTCNDTTAEWSVDSRASRVHLDSTGILALKSFTTSKKDSSTHLAWCSTISFFSYQLETAASLIYIMSNSLTSDLILADMVSVFSTGCWTLPDNSKTFSRDKLDTSLPRPKDNAMRSENIVITSQDETWLKKKLKQRLRCSRGKKENKPQLIMKSVVERYFRHSHVFGWDVSQSNLTSRNQNNDQRRQDFPLRVSAEMWQKSHNRNHYPWTPHTADPVKFAIYKAWNECDGQWPSMRWHWGHTARMFHSFRIAAYLFSSLNLSFNAFGWVDFIAFVTDRNSWANHYSTAWRRELDQSRLLLTAGRKSKSFTTLSHKTTVEKLCQWMMVKRLFRQMIQYTRHWRWEIIYTAWKHGSSVLGQARMGRCWNVNF